MNVAIVFDDVDARLDATADERGVLEAVVAVEEALSRSGHAPRRVPVGGPPLAWLRRLADARADLVFNLCEGVNGSSALEANAASVVALLGLPVTGSTPETLALGRRKDHVNAILDGAGVRVPRWTRIALESPVPEWCHFPAIVKPAAEDASIGITQTSVVRDREELTYAVADARHFETLIVQEFIDGRELNAAIVGNCMLPLAEIDFSNMPAGTWPIVSYDAKWLAGSPEDLGSVPVCPARVTPALAQRITSAAQSAWHALGGTGYGRVDLRVTVDGTPYVLEVNTNPDLSPSAGLARMAAAECWTYTDLVLRIMDEALERHRASLMHGPATTTMTVR